MAKPLSLLDQSSDSEVEFTINKNYAGKYDFWRNKEEMQKLKDLSKDISDTSSSSEDEDEPIIEKDFLKTLSLIKSKDPVIYNENVEFFKEGNAPKKPKIKKEKPMFMKDYERKIILERNGEFSDEDGDRVPPHSLPEELDEVTKSLKAALVSDDETPDSQVGGLFQVRTKSEQEKEDEAEEYLQWLKGQEKNVDKETKKELSFLHRYWNDSNLDEGEKFLRDYLLNQNFTDKDKTGIPSYGDITEDFDTLVEEEETLKQQEQFEQKYNFRFEEPDPEFIKRYPRTVGDSLRRVDNKRKMKREDYTERKKREKDLKREELKRLKALKRKEIEEKFFKLKEASGKEEINFDEDDIESDFDPDKHDEKMKELFNEDYYAVEEEQKPKFLHDEEIDDEDWDHWTRAQVDLKVSEKGPMKHEDEGDSSTNEDQHTDLNTEFEREMLELTHSKRRRGRRKSLFAKLISQPKPLYDPDGKSFEKYLEEYYNLDYEDVIGDLPVRFKYRKVIPNDFGLTADEILAADDKELNRWCSVKKTCQYRRDEEELYEVQAFKKKAQNTAAKEKTLASVYAPPEEEGVLNTNDSKDAVNIPKRKKKRSKKKKFENSIINNEQCNSAQEDAVPPVEESLKDLDSKHVGENLLERKKGKKRSIGCVEISIVASANNDVESSLAAHENISSFKDSMECLDSNNVSKKKRKRKNKADSNDGTVLDSSQMSDTREDKYTKDNGDRDSSIHDPKSSVGGNEQSNSPSKRSKKRRRNKSLRGKGLNIVISANKPQHTASHGDKRLAVSDSRLAAFGINPKKFKNVIIYSSKK